MVGNATSIFTFFGVLICVIFALLNTPHLTLSTFVKSNPERSSVVSAVQPLNIAFMLDLGDVRESARVYLNDQFVGCAWCVPYTLECGKCLKKGKNTLKIEVTNLPANRIADLDCKGVEWRKFNEINVVKIDYSKGTYAHWDPVPSGLNSSVILYKKE